jgi:hypothetical protein
VHARGRGFDLEWIEGGAVRRPGDRTVLVRGISAVEVGRFLMQASEVLGTWAGSHVETVTNVVRLARLASGR